MAGAWVIILIAVTVGYHAFGGTYNDDFSLPGSSAAQGAITCAAVIITCVFLAFLLSSNVVVKMLALGLGVSIIVDASIIRLLVVPATMFLMGRANWWTPRWLSRIPELLEPVELAAASRGLLR